jgi:hypothetical protein
MTTSDSDDVNLLAAHFEEHRTHLSALWQTGSRSKPAVRVIIRTEMPVWSWA